MSTSCEPLFDSYSETYDDVLNEAIRASGETKEYFACGRITWLAERLPRYAVHVRSVLDYGCGIGTSTPFFFATLGAERVIGIDVSAASLAVAERTYGSPQVGFSLVERHETMADIDLAFTNGVFHHIPPEERPAAVNHIVQSLRPGGVLAFWENNAWNPGARYCMRINPFDRDAIAISPIQAARLLSGSGLQILDTTYAFVFPRSLKLFRPLERLLYRLPLGAQFLMLARKPVPAPTT